MNGPPLMTLCVMRKVKKNFKDGKISPPKKKSENTANKSACCRSEASLKTMKIGEPMTDIAVDRWIEEENEKH